MSASGPLDWVGDTDRIRRERENRRDSFTQAQITNPALFVLSDRPLVTLAPGQQRTAIERLREIATAEGSALIDQDWKSLVDPTTNLEANEEALLNNGGKLPIEEREAEQDTARADALEQEKQHARQTIREWADEIERAGVDAERVLTVLFQGGESPLVEAAAEQGVLTPREVEAALDEMAGAFSRGFVQDAIDDAREFTRSERERVEDQERRRIRAELLEEFDVPEEAGLARVIEIIRTRVERARTQERAQILQRVSNAFGRRFESVDGMIEGLQDVVASRATPTIRSTEIRARQGVDAPIIRLESSAEVFTPYISQVRDRAREVLNLDNLVRSNTKIGVLRLEGGEVAAISFDLAPEGLKTDEDMTPAQMTDDDEQDTLPEEEEDDEEADERAREFLSALEGNDG